MNREELLFWSMYWSFPQIPHDKTGQNVVCDLKRGLRCLSNENGGSTCLDYKVSLGCKKDLPHCGKFLTTEQALKT